MNKSIVMMAAATLFFSQSKAQTIDEGVKMLRYEKYESAKKILTPLASGNSLANYYLGVAQLGTEDISAAKATFQKHPEDAANMAGMVRILFAEKKSEDAKKMAEKVADQARKKDQEPLRYAADAITYSQAAGHYPLAIEWYKKYMEKNENAAVYVSMGDAYRKMPGGGGEAMTAYENAVRLDPKNSLAYSRMGEIWYAAKRYDLALENYAKAKEADPQNPLPYRDLAYAYYYVNKFDLSRQNIEQYLQLSDKSVDDQIQYVGILYRGKDYARAIATAQELLNKGETRPGLYGVLAYSQLESGDSINALNNVRTYFSKQASEKIGPDDYIKYGQIFMKNNMLDSATAYFTKGMSMDTSKSKADLYRSIADAYKDLKTEDGYKQAGIWYGKIIAENPNAAALDYFYYGLWNYYGKDLEVAKKAFAAMEKTHPDQPSATYWRGRTAAALDPEAKGDEADDFYIKWLSNPVEKKPADLMQAYQWLALYYFNKNDKGNMNTYLDKIQSIEPENAFAKQLKTLSKK